MNVTGEELEVQREFGKCEDRKSSALFLFSACSCEQHSQERSLKASLSGSQSCLLLNYQSRRAHRTESDTFPLACVVCLSQNCSTWIISHSLLLFSCLQFSSWQRYWPKCYWSLLLWVVNYNYFIMVQNRTDQIFAMDRRVKSSDQTLRHSSETTKPCSGVFGRPKQYCQEV